MAPTSAHTGKVYLTSAKYSASLKPGRFQFTWKYNSQSVDAFSVWFYDINTGKYTIVQPDWPTRVQGNGKGSGLITIDRLVGVAGAYEVKLAAKASELSATAPTKVYDTSARFNVKITDFET